MPLVKPKFISLDTGTWTRLAAAQTSPLVKQVLTVLYTTEIIPYLSIHHLQELFQHQDRHQRELRQKLISRLPLVSFTPLPNNREAGGVLNVRDMEFQEVFADTNARLPHGIRCKITAGLCSGSEFISRNSNACEYCRSAGEGLVQDDAETASLVHFPAVPFDSPIPPLDRLSSGGELPAEGFRRFAAKLAAQIAADGDPKAREKADVLANRLMAEAHVEANHAQATYGDLLGDVYARAEINPFDPPPKTFGELNHCIIFAGWLNVHGRRLGIPAKMLQMRVKAKQLPTWRIWAGLDTVSKRQMTSAAGSDLNDKMMAGLLPYLDAVQLDKRTKECLRQASKTDSYIESCFRKVLPSNLQDLKVALETMIGS